MLSDVRNYGLDGGFMKRNRTLKSNWGKIVNSGAGGFLNPPTHPEHDWSVRSVYDDTFSMALSSAAESDWLDDECRSAARIKLKSWKPLPLDDASVKDWIHQILGYFAGCYVGQDRDGNPSWNASDLRILKDTDPILNANIHAGVYLIRKYYPDFAPSADDFAKAYWGKKINQPTDSTKE